MKKIKNSKGDVRYALAGIYLMRRVSYRDGASMVHEFKNGKISLYKRCYGDDGSIKYTVFSMGLYEIVKTGNILRKYILGIPYLRSRYYMLDGKKVIVPKELCFKKSYSPKVSIIIPVFNQIDYTKVCLTSIYLAKNTIDYEIIIADDNSSDDTRNIQEFAKNVSVIRNESNLGYIRNVNRAAKYAKGKFLYFLNNDTIVHDNWLDELVNVFSIRKDAGVVGSKIENENGSILDCGGFLFSNGQTNSNDYSWLKQVDYVSGCSFLTSAELFNKINGFSEEFCPAYCDDSDYCIAAKYKGFSSYVQPLSVITHFGNASYSKQTKLLIEHNNIILRKKWNLYFNEKRTLDEVNTDTSSFFKSPQILIIDDFLPQYDQHAGGRTIHDFVLLFVKLGLEVKFCSIFSNSKEEPYYSMLCRIGVQVIDHSDLSEHIKAGLDYLFISRPNVISRFLTKSIRSTGTRILYYGHDIHHLRMLRELKLKDSEYDDTSRVKEIEDMKEVEYNAITSSDISFYPSEAEVAYIRNWIPNARVDSITPYIYECNHNTSLDFSSVRSGILFVGSSHSPNMDGILWFIRNIFPLIVKEKNIILHLVGSGYSTGKFPEFLNRNIILHGKISGNQLNALYDSVRLSIAPLRFGAGIKGKIIESVFHNVPVITTPIGQEGIPGSPIITVCHSESEFAFELLRKYEDLNLLNRLSHLCPSFIAQYYSETSALEKLRKYIDTNPRPFNQ